MMLGQGIAPGIVQALGGSWRNGKGLCRCPAHQDKNPSLSVSQTRDGRPLVHCFSGCDQMSVIDALMRAGLWPAGPVQADPSSPHRLTTRPDGLDGEQRKQLDKARTIWDFRKPLAGSHAEAYLRSRCLKGPWPDCLAFHPDLAFWHTTKRGPICLGRYPALLAKISLATGEFTAVQITWLDPKAPRKAEVIDPETGEILVPKKVRGVMRDGAIRLATPFDVLGLAEGTETAMSATQLFRIPTWAVCGVDRLHRIKIPDDIKKLYIFRDNGGPGLAGANKAFDVYSDDYDVIISGPEAGYGDHNDWLQDSPEGRSFREMA